MSEDIVKIVSRALLPIIKPGELKSSLYMLRLTPFDKYTREDVKELMECHEAQWIMSNEYSKAGKNHFHVIFAVDIEYEDVRQHIRDFLSRYFPPELSKRGDANKQYNLKVVNDFDVAVSYIIKDGVYSYSSDIDPLYVKHRFEKSFKKYDKETFAKKLEELKAEFKDDKRITIIQFCTRFVQLKAEYRQPINMNYIYQMAVSCDVNRTPKKAEEYVNDYFIKLGY